VDVGAGWRCEAGRWLGFERVGAYAEVLQLCGGFAEWVVLACSEERAFGPVLGE
jgi:hypothetical protein